MDSTLRVCLDTTIPFRYPIQTTLFLPFQNGEKAAETVPQRNGPLPFPFRSKVVNQPAKWEQNATVVHLPFLFLFLEIGSYALWSHTTRDAVFN